MHITIPLNPLPCPRPRIATRGKFAHAYYPASYKTWKEKAAEYIAERNTRKAPLKGPLMLDVRFYCERPKTTKLDAPKPDIDNYLKSLMDACTAAEVWEDDAQVVYVVARKDWAEPGVAGLIAFTLQPETPT
jgi:Holliday junction resolvase RusA-like endonuclease